MPNLPHPVLRRLPSYLLLLHEDRAAGRTFASSTDWAARLKATPIQVRKDLAWTGAVGIPKKGFCIAELEARIRECLAKDHRRDIFLVGRSPLGLGLASAPSLARRGLSVVGVFDPAARLSRFDDRDLLPWDQFSDLAQKLGVTTALLAVDPALAQRVSDRLVEGGIRVIWNLTGRPLCLPPPTYVLEETFGDTLAETANTQARLSTISLVG